MANKYLNYNYNTWLINRSKKPKGSRVQGAAYYLSPKDIETFQRAFSPYDLWMKPDTRPVPGDTAQAATIKNKIIFPTEASLKYGFVPGWLRPGAQGIYEHEQAHTVDPRMNSYAMWSYPNKGYLTRSGLSGGSLQGELPAMAAEERYIRGRKR